MDETTKAKKDIEIYKLLYNRVFYDDKGNPKLRMWLAKKGVQYNELEEVESIMKAMYVDELNKFEYSHIDFERYIWVKFKQRLCNYFTDQKLKKNADLVFEHSLELKDDERDSKEVFYDRIKFDIGNISDVSLDKDLIASYMNHIQSFIYKCKIYSDYNDNEIIDACSMFNLGRTEYDIELLNVRKIIRKYIEGKL